MKRFNLLITALGMLALSGCVSNSTPPLDRRVTIGPAQSSHVLVTDVKAAQRNSDHLEVQVNLVNTTGSIRTVDYRFVWLDASAMEVAGPQLAPWRSITLQPKEIRSLASVAPTPECIDFRIHVK